MSVQPLPKVFENDGSTKSVFNTLYFTAWDTLITLKDLLPYARQDKENNFTKTNYFQHLYFSQSINNISPTIFNFLDGVSSNIQTQINSLWTWLTNYKYQSETNTQDIQQNTSFSHTLVNSKSVLNHFSACRSVIKLIKNDVFLGNSAKFNKIQSKNMSKVILHCGNYNYPICVSREITNLPSWNNAEEVSLCIAPYTEARVMIDGLLNYTIVNSTNDWLHYQPINNEITHLIIKDLD